jgi:hypothetical protein
MMSGFFGDAWDVLTGKSQAWYANVSKIQSQLNILLAGVTAVTEEIWNAASQAVQGPSPDGTPLSGVSDYNQVVGDITSAISDIIVTKNHVPTDQVIANAQTVASTYQPQLDFVAQIVPEMSAQIQADQATTRAGMPAPMNAPSAVAKEVFFQTLDDRASALGQGLGDIAKYLAYAVGTALLIYGWSKMEGAR